LIGAMANWKIKYMQPIITLQNLNKSFKTGSKQLHVLSDINLTVNEGEFFMFLGPSGSGKSTILRVMSGLEKDFKGKVELGNGMSRKDMSFVFQEFALLPWLTVSENVELGLLARKVEPSERQKIVRKELELLGLDKFGHVYPRDLSGGMKQRVGIARALATSPKIIFLDEPFSELDSFTAEELRKELLKIWQERKMTVVMVSHIVEEALELADRIAIFTPRPSKIERLITNNLPRPRQKRTQEFFNMEDELYKIIKP
jgi:ABC-type nitrate/sulfonate/bicarbonate transport system ATPase subunit